MLCFPSPDQYCTRSQKNRFVCCFFLLLLLFSLDATCILSYRCKICTHSEKVMNGCVGIAILACRTRLLDPNPAAMSDGVATIRISSSSVLHHATETMSVFSASSRTASFKFFFFLQCLFTELQVQHLQIQRSGFARIAISLDAVRLFPNPAISSSTYSPWTRRDECSFVFFGRLLVPDFHSHW